MSPGGKIRRKRKRAEERAKYDAAVAALRAEGYSCESCAHRGRYPDGGNKHICELDSDFSGHTIVQLTDICPRWAQRS